MPPFASSASACVPSPASAQVNPRVLQVLADQIPNARFIVNDQYSCHF